jgi:hypothetical protein
MVNSLYISPYPYLCVLLPYLFSYQFTAYAKECGINLLNFTIKCTTRPLMRDGHMTGTVPCTSFIFSPILGRTLI